MLEKEIIESLSFYYPICKVEGCDGILNIKKNMKNLTINYECENNYMHRKRNINYKDFFLNHYLKEQNFEKCEYKCKSHDKSILYYCNECKKYLCEICFGYCKSHNHSITLKDKYKLSKKQINYLQKSFEEKKNYNNELCLLIDIWKNELYQKLEELKRNLKDEILLIEKLISNYNKDFINLTYHKNILNLKDKINNNYNYWLNEFYYSEDFNDKIYCIFNYFDNCYCSKDYFTKKVKIEKNIGIIDQFLQIKNNYFFGIDQNGTANLYNYNKNEGLNLKYKLKDWKFKNSIPKLSIDKTQIFICNKSKIRILDLDIQNYKIKVNSNKINELKDKNLIYCIEIKKGIIACVCEGDLIFILTLKNNNYEITKKIIYPEYFNDFYEQALNVLSINNEIFVTYTLDFIEFYDVETLNSKKKLKSLFKYNRLELKYESNLKIFNQYLIWLTTWEQIILVYIKTQEIVQYYNFDYNIKNIYIKNDNIIYIEYVYFSLDEVFLNCLKMTDGTLEFYDEKIINDKISDENHRIKNIYFLDDNEMLLEYNFHFKILYNNY